MLYCSQVSQIWMQREFCFRITSSVIHTYRMYRQCCLSPWVCFHYAVNGNPLAGFHFDNIDCPCGMYMCNKHKMNFMPVKYCWPLTLHSRFRQKSSQFIYQKNYPSKSKASFQYLWVRGVHEKILRVCFPRSLGDFGPRSSQIGPYGQISINRPK